jgi:hypothetical protein
VNKITKRLKQATFILGLFAFKNNLAQQIDLSKMGEVHGNVQLDAQYYQEDTLIGALAVPEKMGFNGFANVIYTKGNFTAGIRYESYLAKLQGFDSRYNGSGLTYRFAQYKTDALDVTIGNFYEQFGSGITLRTYEERNLGYDNMLDGFRVKYEPIKGIYLKALIGKQRLYFTPGGVGLVRGVDGEIDINQTFKKLNEAKVHVILGGSFVSKYQKDEDPNLILPENVGNSAGRIRVNFGNFNFSGEYAHKINDPIDSYQINDKPVFRNGNAIIFNASYAQKGFALNVGLNRIENMNFRSDRGAKLNDLFINFIPPLCKQQTYALLTLRPYASQPNGEIEFTGQVDYKVKKGTKLGGKYGWDISVNFSGANALDTTHYNSTDSTSSEFNVDSTLQGYKLNSYGMGKEKFFRDLYIEINKKFSKKLKATFIYDYQEYNYNVIQNGISGEDFVYAHTVIIDATMRLKDEGTLRIELQNLFSDQKTGKQRGDWAAGIIEYTINSSWFAAIQDQWNYGNSDSKKQLHYYGVNVGYIKNATRITLGYGRQRDGVFCVGGVCRQVPASNGISLSITSSF